MVNPDLRQASLEAPEALRSSETLKPTSRFSSLARKMTAPALLLALAGCSTLKSTDPEQCTPTPSDIDATPSEEESPTSSAAKAFYIDNDEDGFGKGEAIIGYETTLPGYSTKNGDCDDLDPNTYPNATEICDGIDNNCNTEDKADEGATSEQFPDNDGDGYGEGVESYTINGCGLIPGYAEEGGDCNDNDANEIPGQADCPKYTLVNEEVPANCQEVFAVDNRPGFYNVDYNKNGELLPVECLADGWTVFYRAKNGSNPHSEINGSYYNPEACPDIESACKRYVPDYVDSQNNLLRIGIDYTDGNSNFAVVSAGDEVFDYFKGNPGSYGWAPLYPKGGSENFDLNCYPKFVDIGNEHDQHSPIFTGDDANDPANVFWATYDKDSPDWDSTARHCGENIDDSGNPVTIAFKAVQ